MKVYLAITEDRHCDIQINAFSTLELAVAKAKKDVDWYKSYYKEKEWDVEWDMTCYGGLPYSASVEDGPTIWVEEKEVDACGK